MFWKLMAGSIKDQVEGVNNGESLEQDVGSVINIIIYMIGIVAVIIIIIGGLTYITSQGDPDKIRKGKNTVLYGIIGLVIVVLAFAIVKFVVGSL